jgi:uncharacterized protein YjbI with pentapeptide repeats
MPSKNKNRKETRNPKSSACPPKKSASINWRILRWRIWYRITSPFRAIGNLLSRVFTIYRVAILLVVIAVALWHFNHISIDALLPNIVTDLLGVALTVFIIDTMYRLRSDAERKKILIAKLGSKNNAVATEALHELDAQGWLSDGSLYRAFLLSCNLDGNSFTGADLRRVSFSFASLRDTTWFEADLQGAFLDHADLSNATFSMHAVGPHFTEADLTGATLTTANLSGAKVRHEQLCRAGTLWRAKMSDGQLYDGRYNFPNDIELFLKYARNPNNPQEWADFYGVSLDRYLEGQVWAQANLSFMRSPVSA